VKSSFVVIAVALGLSGAATAEPIRLAQTFAADIVPPYEVFTIIRSMGLRPLGRPHFRGRSYIVHAMDRRGEELRVVVDARAARVVSVTPIDRQAATEYDDPPVYRRYESGPPPVSGPRVIEAEPRYVPPRAVPSDPRYGAPRALPEDDDYPGEGLDEFDADDEGETGSLPQWQAPRSLAAPRTPSGAPSTRSAAVAPPKTPLPRPRPQQLAKASESEVAATASAGVEAEDLKADASAQDAVKAEGQKAEAGKSDPSKAEAPKSGIRIIEIKRPEPRI